MMDIKVKKINKVETAKVVAKQAVKPVAKQIVTEVEEDELVESTLELNAQRVPLRKVSKLSVFMFTSMSLSLMCYIFMISSSVFYAVKASQFAFDGSNLPGGYVEGSIDKTFSNKENSGRISYINKDSATSISLK